jgi:riboflavin synthase
MFTGLVEAMARIRRRDSRGPGVRMEIESPAWSEPLKIGQSLAVNGCCLTAVAVWPEAIELDLGPETLARTNLGSSPMERGVNLERPLRLGDALGGHLVTGHVDALGTLVERRDEQGWSWFRFQVPTELIRQMAPKGSVAVDGVSLTIVDVRSPHFTVQLIPHTLAVTTLGSLEPGDSVNIETDVLAKYVEAQLGWRDGHPS